MAPKHLFCLAISALILLAAAPSVALADVNTQMYKDPAFPVLNGEMQRWHWVEILEVFPEEQVIVVNNAKDNRVYEVRPLSPALKLTDMENYPISFWDLAEGDKLFVRDLGVKDYVIKAEMIQMIDEENYRSHGGIAILGEERFDVYSDPTSNYAFSSKTFPDVPEDHKYAKSIEYLRYNGYVRGYNDGSFGPERKITRSEALKLLLFGSGVGVNPDHVQTDFADIDSTKWYAPYVKRARELNIIHGYADNTFKPNHLLKRAEALKIIFHAMGYLMPESVVVKPYEDVSVEDWPAPYFHYAKQRNLLMNEGEMIRPWDYITRAELADLMYRVIVITRTNAIRYEDSLDPYNKVINGKEKEVIIIPETPAPKEKEEDVRPELKALLEFKGSTELE